MKRIDELFAPVLTRICRGNTELSPEQKKRNQQWVVKIRKQIDQARINNMESK
ncbi:hypothetical protein [Escherichia albertii]|uniref:hypothetical protein n=1 Tax=Escherichia albertii TaxID=208962 RepID=UPI0017A11F38|nr:hypothetical protein [Escherichia albertii]MCZ8661472.1 hypothetical protein [Escherichia albertii]MCZ9009720.1 hypothetical protein [Escherichia albertii]HCZ5333269.1 hypothetical protein [Escherichia albertii]